MQPHLVEWGGWELGLNACGWELQWQCECDPFCRAVLEERFGVPIAPDIKTLTTWLVQRFGSIASSQVDALIGSPPCPPFSVAGAKRGIADERHLYPAFIAAVSVLKPRWVLMEQVAGLLSDRRAFGEYIGGLVKIGYNVLWHSIPACAVGAPHQRDRVWIMAHSECSGRRTWSYEAHSREGSNRVEHSSSMADSTSKRTRPAQLTRQPHGSQFSRPNVPNPNDGKGGSQQQAQGTWQRGAEPSGICPDVSNSESDLWRTPRHDGPETFDGRSAATDTNGKGLPRQRKVTCGTGAKLAHIGDHCGWHAEPDVGRVAHGVPNRVDRLRALGNAVVPQIPFEIGQAINEIEDDLTKQL